jgi:hypothetical protein
MRDGKIENKMENTEERERISKKEWEGTVNEVWDIKKECGDCRSCEEKKTQEERWRREMNEKGEKN